MARMGPESFKTLVGMASSFQELANPDEVSPAAAREAQVMAGLAALQRCRLDKDSELSDGDVARFNLRFRPSLGSSLDSTIRHIHRDALSIRADLSKAISQDRLLKGSAPVPSTVAGGKSKKVPPALGLGLGGQGASWNHMGAN